MFACKSPAEQSRAGATNMKKTRRGGGKSRDDFCLRADHIACGSPEYTPQLLVASPQVVETLS